MSSSVGPNVACVKKRDTNTFGSCETSALPLYVRSWYVAPAGSVVEHTTGAAVVHSKLTGLVVVAIEASHVLPL